MKKPKPPAEISDAAKAAAEQQILEQSKRIDFYLTEYSVEILANKMRDGEFQVPPYQREFVWEHERQSRFIESVIMGLPIPFLFFWEMGDGRLEIVDGSQRLRTLQDFVLGDLRLGDLESLPAVSNFKFADLPDSRQRKIKNRSIRGIVLNEHADEQARFDMFERINTGSKVAEAPEVRRGALAGPFMSLIIELAELPAFTAIAPISDKLRKQREHEELVTRFFAYGDGLDGYKDRPSEFLFNYVKKMNPVFVTSPQMADEYRQRFVRMVDFVGATFPNGFRRAPKGTATPRARFEAISLGSHFALNVAPQLRDHGPDIGSWIEGEEFAAITGGDGANAIGRLQRRMNFVRDKLLGA
jgi:Protein of unknown function DUF262